MFQGQLAQVTVSLTSGGLSVSGVVATDLTFKYWRQGDTAFTVLAVDSANWLELGLGVYAFTLPAALLSVLGTFYFRLTGTTFDLCEREYFIEPAPLQLAALPNKCIITGNIIDLTGEATQADKIVFRVVSLPVRVGGSIVSSTRVVSTPDALGNFSVPLLQGAVVSVSTEQSGISSEFVVPVQSNAQLLDLLPPFPVPPFP